MRAIGEADYERYLEELKREFPGLRIVSKEGDAFSERIAFLLRTVTLGAQNTYLEHYTTVLGRTIYVPTSWSRMKPADRYIVLRHEAVHLRQAKRLTSVGMTLLYAWPIFPVGLAWGRAMLEWEAYRETIRTTAEVYGREAARSDALRSRIRSQFTSGAYGWMWPFPAQVDSWIDDALAEL